jgi:hypothetical protein
LDGNVSDHVTKLEGAGLPSFPLGVEQGIP